jgi:hypothetical protein
MKTALGESKAVAPTEDKSRRTEVNNETTRFVNLEINFMTS